MLADLLAAGHVLQPTFEPGKPDFTAYQEGERNIVLRIVSMLNMRDMDINKLNDIATQEDEHVRRYANNTAG